MTNEELAEQIQEGNKQLIPELWERSSALCSGFHMPITRSI